MGWLKYHTLIKLAKGEDLTPSVTEYNKQIPYKQESEYSYREMFLGNSKPISEWNGEDLLASILWMGVFYPTLAIAFLLPIFIILQIMAGIPVDTNK